MTSKLCSTLPEPENPFKMAAVGISSSLFSVSNLTDNLTKGAIDEETSHGDWLKKTREMMTINLKTALKASKVALANEKQKRVNDRRTYETIIAKIRNHYKNKLQESRASPFSQQSQPAQLARQSRQSARQSCVDQSVQTLHNHVADQSVQTESNDEEFVGESAEAAAAVTLQAEVNQLKKKMAELVFVNNRYHLALSNCTFCASDEPDSPDASSFLDVSIRASTPLPSSDPDLPLQSSPIPSLMSLTFEDKRKVKVKTVEKSKDTTFISRMIKTLAKLETKYLTPQHKRKKRLFTRKQKTCSIVPKEFASIYHVLAAPEPEAVAIPDPFPHVRWSDVRFKPALPNPEQCPVHSCSPNPAFYVEEGDPLYNGTRNFGSLVRQYGASFGTLPGYKTNLGVVAVPTTPVGGYVYFPDAKKWVLYAEPCSSPSAGRGTRRGGTPVARRRKG